MAENRASGDAGFYTNERVPCFDNDFVHRLTFDVVYFQPLVKFKSHLYFEEKDYVQETEKTLKPLKGSLVIT